jgi:hypothetical protein
MNLMGNDLEHVLVVLGGLFAPIAKAGLTALIAGDKVEGNFAYQGEVAGGGAIARLCVNPGRERHGGVRSCLRIRGPQIGKWRLTLC